MESETLQRKQKYPIGNNLEAEMVPMEHTVKKEGKIVTFIKAALQCPAEMRCQSLRKSRSP